MDSKNQTPRSDDRDPTAARVVAEVTELAGGLAHELRNPLSTMMIQLDLLAEDLNDATASPTDIRRRACFKVDVLRQEARRLQTLFDEFLTLTGPCKLHREPVDLNLLVEQMGDFSRPELARSGVVLSVEVAPEPVICKVDEGMIRRALLNIVINARQAMPDGGGLQLDAVPDGRWGVIRVTDTGVGIAEPDRERVFRPFFSTKSGGSGLGLSITRRIVNEHGGTLSFESDCDRGTSFIMRLPRDEGSANEPTGRR